MFSSSFASDERLELEEQSPQQMDMPFPWLAGERKKKASAVTFCFPTLVPNSKQVVQLPTERLDNARAI